jgi:hypothetical protein
MLQFPFLQPQRTIPFVALVIPLFHSTTLATPYLCLAHGLARYLETPVILEARGVTKVSVALVAGNPNIVRDARINA